MPCNFIFIYIFVTQFHLKLFYSKQESILFILAWSGGFLKSEKVFGWMLTIKLNASNWICTVSNFKFCEWSYQMAQTKQCNGEQQRQQQRKHSDAIRWNNISSIQRLALASASSSSSLSLSRRHRCCLSAWDN